MPKALAEKFKGRKGIIGILVIILCVTFYALVWRSWERTRLSLTVQKIISLHKSDLPGIPMDTYFFAGNGSGKKNLLVSRLDRDQKTQEYRSTSLRLLVNRGETWEEAKLPPAPMYHPRHLVVDDVNGDGKPDLLVADHGIDFPPFPGGHSQLFLSEPNGFHLATAQEAPWKKAFTYHNCILDLNGDGKPDILQMNLGPDLDSLKAFAGDGHGRFKAMESWYEPNTKIPKSCFMSCLTADLDGQTELILGACDRDPKGEAGAPNDLIFKKNGSGKFALAGVLPARYKDKSWGTANLATGHFSPQSKGQDIVAVTHNYGFTEARVQVFLNQGDLKFTEIPVPYALKEGTKSFIPYVHVGDLNGDGLDDILILLRSMSEAIDDQVQVFLSNGRGFDRAKFSDSSFLKEPFVGGDIFDIYGRGKNDIVLVTYGEELVVLKVK